MPISKSAERILKERLKEYRSLITIMAAIMLGDQESDDVEQETLEKIVDKLAEHGFIEVSD